MWFLKTSMSSSNLIKIFCQKTRNEQTYFLSKNALPAYIPGYELKSAAAAVRTGGRTTAMRSTSFLFGVLLPRSRPWPGEPRRKGKKQLRVHSLEKSHRGTSPSAGQRSRGKETLRSFLQQQTKGRSPEKRQSESILQEWGRGEHCLQPFPAQNTSYSAAGYRWP